MVTQEAVFPRKGRMKEQSFPRGEIIRTNKIIV